MSEWTLITLSAFKLLAVGVFAVLYTVGGRGPKLFRRWIGGLFIVVSSIGFSLIQGTFSIMEIAALAAVPAALSLGYGSESFLGKIIRRTIYGVALGSTTMFFAYPDHVSLGVFQIGLAVVASVFLGVWNPVKAVEEETLIATLSVICMPFAV